MGKRNRTDWRSPLNIPEGKCGDYSIKHEIIPAGQPVMMNNFRNMIFAGQKAERSVSFPTETKWHKLCKGSGTWMTDFPVEQRQHDELLQGFAGNVLVGGLGLGYACHVLAKKKAVLHITVVEISEEVINLVGPYVDSKKVRIVHKDLMEFIKRPSEYFNFAFYDIWASDGERIFFQTVVPLLEASTHFVANHPACWNENVMRGQLVMSLINRIMMESHRELFERPDGATPYWEVSNCDNEETRMFHNWCVPFFQWWHTAHPIQKEAHQKAQVYAGLYGLYNWEKLWKEEINDSV